MSFTVQMPITESTTEMRAAFCEAMLSLAEKDERIFLLDADLMGAMGTKPFAKAYPERTIDCGIQEANMIGVAAGLSAEGKIPFAHTFGVFMSRRVCDQIFISCAYAKQNVKLVGSDPGITAALNGGTHMAFEDLGIMRTIPGITIVEPTDIAMIRDLVPKIAYHPGVVYLRLVRRTCPVVYGDGSTFEIGKANLLRDGKDVTIIAVGLNVGMALKAADALAAEGISARVLDMHTIKPLDEEAVLAAAKETGCIVTSEEHSVLGGLGGAVCEYLSGTCPVPVVRHGVNDTFGRSGSANKVLEYFGLTAEEIAKKAKQAIAMKK